MKKLLFTAVIITVAFAGLFGVRAYNQRKYHLEQKTRFMMDTYVTIMAGGPAGRAKTAITAALDRIEEIDKKMNPINPGSPLYAFNEKGIPIDDPEVVELARQGMEVSELSGGAFDMTLLPLTKLWGFSTGASHPPALPPDNEIKKTLAGTGYRYLVIKGGKIHKLKPGITLDFGGIAKGYAVGEALKVLKKEGITSALIDAGGDIFTLGKRPGGKPWKVGVKDPRGEGMLGYLEMTDLSIACSGDYERFFMKDGKRYHHIFNDKTGYPADGGLISASIIYGDCTLTDVWTKVLFVLGPEKGMELVKKKPGMEAIMVTSAGKVLVSPGLEGALRSLEK